MDEIARATPMTRALDYALAVIVLTPISVLLAVLLVAALGIAAGVEAVRRP